MTRPPTYFLRAPGNPRADHLYDTEGAAVKDAKRIAKDIGKPVLVECNYYDGAGWQPLRIEGRAE